MELVYQSFTLPKFDSEFTPEKLPFAPIGKLFSKHHGFQG